jgi:hypothetical protein
MVLEYHFFSPHSVCLVATVHHPQTVERYQNAAPAV